MMNKEGGNNFMVKGELNRLLENRPSRELLQERNILIREVKKDDNGRPVGVGISNNNRSASKVYTKRALKKLLKNRPSRRELVAKNILLADPEPIPLKLPIFYEICSDLEAVALDIEGIFRVPGIQGVVREVWETFDDDCGYVRIPNVSPHELGGALKMYLREQNNPLIPFNLFDTFIDAETKYQNEPDHNIEHIKSAIEMLPDENRRILQTLALLLLKISNHEEKNKMSAANLGIVFGPTIMNEEGATMTSSLGKYSIQCDLTTHIIENAQTLFDENIDPSLLEIQEEADPCFELTKKEMKLMEKLEKREKRDKEKELKESQKRQKKEDKEREKRERKEQKDKEKMEKKMNKKKK